MAREALTACTCECTLLAHAVQSGEGHTDKSREFAYFPLLFSLPLTTAEDEIRSVYRAQFFDGGGVRSAQQLERLFSVVDHRVDVVHLDGNAESLVKEGTVYR
jgi:hypothetical protein